MMPPPHRGLPESTPPRHGPQRGWALVAVLAVIVVVVGGVAFQRSVSSSAADAGPLTASRVVQAGDVSVTVSPKGAQSGTVDFTIAVDTHAGSLDLDVAAASTLLVDGVAAGSATWTGAGPGGHHREGELQFMTTSQPREMTLTIVGLPGPVQLNWPSREADH